MSRKLRLFALTLLAACALGALAAGSADSHAVATDPPYPCGGGCWGNDWH